MLHDRARRPTIRIPHPLAASLAVCALSLLASARSPAADLSKGAEKDSSASTATARAEPLDVTVELSGVLRARRMHEVSVAPEQLSEFTVTSAAAHGDRVRRGDVIVRFDTRKIDQAIRDLEFDTRAGASTLAQAEQALALAKRSMPLQLADAELVNRQSAENLRDFLEKVRPRTLKEIDFQMNQAEQNLTYIQEELKQLEQMYKKDDLVEKTEEIVLRRVRNDVEAGKHSVVMARANRDWQLTYGLPRQEISLRNAAAQAAVGLEKAKLTLPQALIEQELNVKRQQYDGEKRADKLAQHRRDRERLTVRAPASGTVFYGQATRGAWPALESVASALAAGGQVRAGQVFMTIVDLESPVLLANVDESQLRQVRSGLRGTFQYKADPQHEIPATLAHISPIPTGPGRFDAEIDVDAPAGRGPASVPLVPGMNGSAKFIVYSNPKAVMVPAAAVKTDRDDETYVMLVRDGAQQRRSVKVGQRVKDQAEILSGLKAGDIVQLKDGDAK